MPVLQDPPAATRECPKCFLPSETSVRECPGCGVVIERAAAAMARRRERAEQAALGSGHSLERLREADQLLIRQQVERMEAWIGIETANSYNVIDPLGNVLFLALEESTGGLSQFLSRQFLKAFRPFRIDIHSPDGEPVLTLDRPFRFYFHELRVLNACGTQLGTVRRLFSVFNRRYELRCDGRPEIFELFGPLFRPWTFKIVRGGEEHGAIRKKWSGLGRELFTDSDDFGIEFPPGIDEGLKAVFLGAVFLIDFAHFEDNNDR